MSFITQPKKTLNATSDTSGFSVAVIFLLGWAVLYGPVYMEWTQNAWTRDENSHAMFLLAFCLISVFLRIKSTDFSHVVTPKVDFFFSIVFLSLGAVFYFSGRFFDVELVLSLSQIVIMAGALLFLGGRSLLRKTWFSVVMLAYVVILPGWILDSFTAPLKQWISTIVAALLSWSGLPIAQSGVILVIGPYQMLVADACSGINSLISLTAIGAIYLYIVRYGNIWRNALIFLSVIPIAIFANIIRVITLILLTHYVGYDAGQGFLHDFAGFFLFGIALLGVFLVDTLLGGKLKGGGND